MTPKEKALVIHRDIFSITPEWMDDLECAEFVNKCALLAVGELIKEASDKFTNLRFSGCRLTDKEYWGEVKKEIEKL